VIKLNEIDQKGGKSFAKSKENSGSCVLWGVEEK
jgi:hypothetical protein